MIHYPVRKSETKKKNPLAGAPNDGVPQIMCSAGGVCAGWKRSVVKLLGKGGLACAGSNIFVLTVIGNECPHIVSSCHLPPPPLPTSGLFTRPRVGHRPGSVQRTRARSGWGLGRSWVTRVSSFFARLKGLVTTGWVDPGQISQCLHEETEEISNLLAGSTRVSRRVTRQGGLTQLDYCFHVNAYKHLTAKGLPAAVIQPGVKKQPGLV